MMLKITLSSGLVGKKKIHRQVIKALGLGKFSSSVLHEDTPIIRGMVHKVRHLITITNADKSTAIAQKPQKDK